MQDKKILGFATHYKASLFSGLSAIILP